MLDGSIALMCYDVLNVLNVLNVLFVLNVSLYDMDKKFIYTYSYTLYGVIQWYSTR